MNGTPEGNNIIIALDTDTVSDALEIISNFRMSEERPWFKVGSVL